MDQNQFLNAYIENTHKALSEATTKSIGLSTSLQLAEAAVKERDEIIVQLQEKISVLNDNVTNLNAQYNMALGQFQELQAQNENDGKEHIDTFKNALVEARAKIADLEKQLAKKNKPEKETVESNG